MKRRKGSMWNFPTSISARRSSTVLVGIALAALTVPAAAEITVHEARYGAGVLVLRGETARPNQVVDIDGRYFTRTDKFKQFRFRIRYLPHNCSVTIAAGREKRPAMVAGCDILNTRRQRLPR